MGNKKHRPIKKGLKNGLQNKKGETLVETIVSFVIVLIALAAITSMIRSSTAMNVKARENSDKIEKAAVQVEQSGGESAGKGSMTMDFGDGKPVKVEFDVKKAEPFIFFTPVSGGDNG